MNIKVQVNKRYDELIYSFIEFLCKELSIHPRSLSIDSCDLEGSTGMCFDEDDMSYTILVREKNRKIENVFITIAHEMVHVKQYILDELGKLLDESRDLPYDQRWWEIEAKNKSLSLVEKFSKEIK